MRIATDGKGFTHILSSKRIDSSTDSVRNDRFSFRSRYLHLCWLFMLAGAIVVSRSFSIVQAQRALTDVDEQSTRTLRLLTSRLAPSECDLSEYQLKDENRDVNSTCA